MDFLVDFGLRNTFHEHIAPKSIAIDIEKLHMKFSALNVDFKVQVLITRSSKRPANFQQMYSKYT